MGQKLIVLTLLLLTAACSKPDPKDIHTAARRGSEQMVSQALELGVDINQKVDGKTALFEAAKAGRAKMVAFLLEKGADPNIPNEQGKTPWQAIFDQSFFIGGQDDCAVALLEGGVKPGSLEGTTYLHKAAKMSNNSRLIARLVESGIEPDARDSHGWTPLHVAANKPSPDNVLALLTAKADPNAETTETWEEVIDHPDGADVRFRYQAGSRPLDVARHGTGRGKSAHSILQEWGAKKNPEVKNVIR